MLINEAKLEIKRTIEIYLQKDAIGNYIIPVAQQRPILLYGAPGIGKTAIMSQIAEELGIGFLSYTITHHTRQSAIGLPFITKKMYNGVEYSVSEYTMSEIIASVYDKIESSNQKEGILFIDEINCVSETLAPAMLDLLQNKKFGPHHIPNGWILISAGNPKEYNKSVKDFDIVTLDRVKKINVTTDFESFNKYASLKGVNDAILYYLQLKPNNLLVFEKTIDGMNFVTPRGWEDLSTAINSYNRLGFLIDITLIDQYIQHPKISLDFTNYYNLYMKYKDRYDVESILNGNYDKYITKLENAKFDEKLAVIQLLIDYINNKIEEYNVEVDALNEFKAINKEDFIDKIVILEKEAKEKKSKKLIRLILMIKNNEDCEKQEELNAIMKNNIIKYIEMSLEFLDKSFGKTQELYLYLVNILNNVNLIMFISRNRVVKFFEYNSLLVNNTKNKEIMKQIDSLNM